MKPNKITTPSEHRAILLACIEGVCEGRISVPMANSVADLSQQVHQSIKSEWDMRCYAAENLALANGRVIDMLEVDGEDSNGNDTD